MNPKDDNNPHPMEATLANRFEFLDVEQRAILLDVIKRSALGAYVAKCRRRDGRYNVEAFVADLADIVRELAYHIDSEAEWQRIEKAPIEEVRAELRAAGVDPDECVRDIRELLEKHGIKANPETPTTATAPETTTQQL